MKHKPKIVIILLLAMFLLTQLVGIYVVNHYSDTKVIDKEPVNVTAPELPLGLETPEVEKETDFLSTFLPSIILAFIIAIFLFFLLTKFKAEFIIKLWFFIVVIIALTISLLTFVPEFKYAFMIILLLSVILAFFKIYQRNFLVHNATELLIYPGIAAIFVPILNVYTMIALLILISIYDMWAVWHSKTMQKTAKYLINKLNIFSGFFVPYLSKKQKAKIKNMKRSEAKSKKEKGKKMKVNVAILGGGDVVFPIIAAGVILKEFGFITLGSIGSIVIQLPLASLFVSIGALLGLGGLFYFSEKKKFYPAMPFITAGILAGIGLSYLLL